MDKYIQEKLLMIEERLKKLEDENNILKIEYANSIIEKVKLDEAKGKFVSNQITQNEKYVSIIDEEVNRLLGYIDKLKERINEVETENKILLSERENGLLKEVLRQAEKLKKKTGENPFNI